jgi:beta-lactamase class A
MMIESEVLQWLSGSAPPLQVIGQRMIQRAQREPACSYRWCIRDIVRDTCHEYNEQVCSPASSTRKLFILVAVLLQIERGELALGDSIAVDNRKAGEQICGGLWLLDRPRTFTVAELLKLMMALSDNVATFYLVERLTLKRLNALSSALGLSGTWHLSAVPKQTLACDHRLSEVNTTTASDLVKALSLMVEGAGGRLPNGETFIRPQLCEFGLRIMQWQQETTAIGSWLSNEDHVGDKHGVGYRNYNNVGYLARGGKVQMIFSIIVDNLHRIERPIPAFAYARDFIALFSRLLDDYSKREHFSKEF